MLPWHFELMGQFGEGINGAISQFSVGNEHINMKAKKKIQS